ncbi:excinuclease ABC subunit UvrA, partial [Candidatus Parcubacteria bacterium]|nr:excinuclease ABC subunit UvrA [Candidatus Parcubacteria bacterium]
MSYINSIKIKGARVHNLKNINVEIPRDKFTVITGLSGSGKSSLAFDTIYAEGQRRYVESLSAYARQFIGLMDKPDVDLIEGLSPAIAIDQKSCSQNPRSTVGTVTEIYDYLRLLFARIGVPHCPECGKKIKQHSIDEIVRQAANSFADKEVIILSPIVKDKKGEHKNILDGIAKAGYSRVRFDKNIYSLEEIGDMNVDKNKKHNMDIVIDMLTASKDKEDMARFTEAIEKALDFSNGLVTIFQPRPNPPLGKGREQIPPPCEGGGRGEVVYSQLFACPDCGISMPELEPRNFSFNSPHGACAECSGLGTKLEVDPELIINPGLTIAQGAIKPWAHNTAAGQSWLMRILGAVAQKYNFDLNTPIKNLTKKQLDIALYGTGGKSYNVDYESDRFSGELTTEFEGVIPNLERRYKQTESDYVRKEIENYMRVLVCPACKGKRLKPEILSVKIPGLFADNIELSINDITTKDIRQAEKFFSEMESSKKLSARNKKISAQIIKEIRARLSFLLNVGLDYLTLDRAANTLSGGEAQRIRLATQIGSSLMGVIYILDEPSIGLHQKDNDKLIDALKKLRDLGNTIIVVEHDKATMLAADYIIDVGPGAGEHGGEIVAAGTAARIKKCAKSLTGQYLSGKKSIPEPQEYRRGNGKK